jgi:hypothetical protein
MCVVLDSRLVVLFSMQTLSYRSRSVFFFLHHGGVTSDENRRKKSCSDPFRFLFCSVCFRSCGILETGERVFPSVSVGSCFHPDLTRMYSVFHPVLNLREICLEFDMFINLLIANYAR